MGREIFTTAQFKAAIPKSGGLFATIAKRVGCDRHTAKKRIMESPTLKQDWEDETETILDLAESKAMELVNAGDPGMIRFYLATKGRSRGYVERQEIRNVDDAEIDAEIERELARVATKRKAPDVAALADDTDG